MSMIWRSKKTRESGGSGGREIGRIQWARKEAARTKYVTPLLIFQTKLMWGQEVDLVNDLTMQLTTSSSNLANSTPFEDGDDCTSTSDVDDDNAEDEEDASLPLLKLVSYDLSISPALMDPRRLFDEIAASEQVREQQF
jgi:hypothetical protein